MVLLAGGALLARSFWNIEKQSLGMNAENIVTAAISLGQTSYPTPESQMAFFQRLEHNLRYGPGVAAFALSRVLSSPLFNVRPHDPVAFAGVTGLLVLISFLAALIPGSSATRVNPTVALRCD